MHSNFHGLFWSIGILQIPKRFSDFRSRFQGISPPQYPHKDTGNEEASNCETDQNQQTMRGRFLIWGDCRFHDLNNGRIL